MKMPRPKRKETTSKQPAGKQKLKLKKELKVEESGGVPEETVVKDDQKTSSVQRDQNGEVNLQSKIRGRKRLQTRENEVLKKKKTKKREISPLQMPSILSYKGVVLAIGQGDVGQLGLGPDVYERNRPAVVTFPEPVVDIAAGGMHSAVLTTSGKVYTFGCNDDGALGRETVDESEQMMPAVVNLPEKIVQISAGDSHTVALSETGNVYVWGNFRDSSGSIGLTVEGKQPLPVQIMQGKTVVQVASGGDHTICLTNEGVIYSCGNCEQGQLGRIPRHNIDKGGRRGIGLLLTPEPVRVGPKSAPVEFDRIWTCSYGTFARERTSGAIYGFGLDNYFQLGFPDQVMRLCPERIQSFSGEKWHLITGGQHHTLALSDTGRVYALGRKDYGRLGLGEDAQDTSTPTVIPTLMDVTCTHISCGNIVSFAVSNTGTLYSFGMGTNQQLGHGNNDDDVFIPKAVSGKELLSRRVVKVSGGGQHVLVLAEERTDN